MDQQKMKRKERKERKKEIHYSAVVTGIDQRDQVYNIKQIRLMDTHTLYIYHWMWDEGFDSI